MLTQYENLTLMLQTANCQKLEDYHAEIVVAIPETADISEQQIWPNNWLDKSIIRQTGNHSNLFYCTMTKIFVNYTFQYFSPKLSFSNQIRELSSSYIKSHLITCWFDQFPTNTCLRNVVVRLAIIKRSSIDDLQVLVHSKRSHSSKNTKKLSCICRKIRIFLSWGIKRHMANKHYLRSSLFKSTA